jgi:Ca2+-binding EF-hand superfamily protein
MLGYVSESKLRNLLVAVGDGERDLEASRQRLCNIRDFALLAAFERIDRDATGTITSIELVNFLRENGVAHISEGEAYNLICFFDSDGNKRLSFQEFIQIVLPCEDNVLRNITIDRPSVRVGRFDRLPVDIEHAVTAVLEKEVNLARRIEGLKRDLELGLDYTAVAAFRSVDRYNSGLITTVNLGAFLRDQGHWASESELLAIVRRIDTDGDASIDLREWSEFLRPAAAPTSSIIAHTIVDPALPLPMPRHRYWDLPSPAAAYDPYYSRYYAGYTRPSYYYGDVYPVPRAVIDPIAPVTKTESYEVERGPYWHSPSRTVKKTTYHTPSGARTYTNYL